MANTELPIGSVDKHGYIVYEEKEISDEDFEWIGETQDRLILNNTEFSLLFKMMDRGATRKEAEKTLLQLREKATDHKDVLNELVKKKEEENKEE